MFILLTNDDGIRAPGIVAMYRALVAAGHEVQVVAPETVQSATGHGITMATPLLTSKVATRFVTWRSPTFFKLKFNVTNSPGSITPFAQPSERIPYELVCTFGATGGKVKS